MTIDTLPGSEESLEYTPPPGYGRTNSHDGFDNPAILDSPPARIRRETRSSLPRDRHRSTLPPSRAHSHNTNVPVLPRSDSILYVSSDPPEPRADNTNMIREQGLDIRELKIQSHQIATKLDELK